MHLDGQIAVISGASSGIGGATARTLARHGAQVVLLARSTAALEQVAQQIASAAGQADVHTVDLADSDALDRTARAVLEQFGTPNILVNNAGAGRWLFADETSACEARQMMDVPYLAAFGLTRAFLPGMLARRSGHIVNVTSLAAYFTWPGATAYTAARWAMRGFSEALRADLKGTGVSVTLFAAATVDSPYWQHNTGSEERLPGISTSLPRLSPERVAQAIATAIERRQQEVIVPRMAAFLVYLHRLAPALVERRLVSTGYHRPPSSSVVLRKG